MKALQRNILEKLIAASAEPLLVARIDSADWPVVLANDAFAAISGDSLAHGQPLADVVEALVGRDLALELSESIRSGEETSIPVEIQGNEFLLTLRPVSGEKSSSGHYYAVYWRLATGYGVSAPAQDAHQALVNAKRRIRDLSRDDPVTGLLNITAFDEVLAHDWSVARREKTSLTLVAFSLDHFDEYLNVFGRHASDSCLRRGAQAIRRCLRRASDVAACVEGDNGCRMVVLSHASEEDGVREFASRIAQAVRELGLHHPRSRASKYVTVSFNIAIMNAAEGGADANEFLQGVLQN
jgi:diguanylate cyclase (GGDEF)-like protein